MQLRKSLGQHFLIDENICTKIFNTIHALAYHNVIEIGSGAGALTKHFVKNNLLNRFLCCEIDKEKIDFLLKHYPALKNKIIHADFLKLSIPFHGEDFIIIGNFPYNISSQIIFKVIDWNKSINHMVGMFQKEVAQRIIAKPSTSEYGILSVLTQVFYDGEILFDISPNCFQPVPKVWSSVLHLKKKNNILPIQDFGLFKTIVKIAFQQRRKKLRNALSILPLNLVDKNLLDLRAENLNVENYFDLYLAIKAIKQKI